MTYFSLKQGDRVELKYDFDRGRFQAGHRGTVQHVSRLNKNYVKVSVLFDGDNAPYEFSPQTSSVLRRLVSLSDPLDSFVEELLDIARENPIDDARIIIRDRLVKDARRALVAQYYCPEHKYNPPPNSSIALCPQCEIIAGNWGR